MAMYYKDIPPFFMHDDQGNFYGLDVELARDIGKKLGVSVKFNRSARTFDQIVEIVASHEADVAISLLSRTLKRAEKVRYTSPYIILRQGLLINRLNLARLPEQKNIVQTLNQPEAVIGVKDGTSYVGFAQKLFPKATIRKYPEWNPGAVQAVISGRITAGYHDETEIKKYIITRPETAIQVTTAVIQDVTDPIAMALPWDSHALLDWLNIYIEQFTQKLNGDQLIEKYMKDLQ